MDSLQNGEYSDIANIIESFLREFTDITLPYNIPGIMKEKVDLIIEKRRENFIRDFEKGNLEEYTEISVLALDLALSKNTITLPKQENFIIQCYRRGYPVTRQHFITLSESLERSKLDHLVYTIIVYRKVLSFLLSLIKTEEVSILFKLISLVVHMRSEIVTTDFIIFSHEILNRKTEIIDFMLLTHSPIETWNSFLNESMFLSSNLYRSEVEDTIFEFLEKFYIHNKLYRISDTKIKMLLQEQCRERYSNIPPIYNLLDSSEDITDPRCSSQEECYYSSEDL